MTARPVFALLAGALLLAGCGSSSGGASSSEPTTSPAKTAAAASPDQSATTAASTTSNGLTIHAIDPSKFERGSSVGFGQGPAPEIAPVVRRAAKQAKCTLRSDPSAVGIHLLLSDLAPLHFQSPNYRKQPLPPTNGQHRPIWANWGFYQEPIPYAYEVHNLEHGAVIVHLGLRVKQADGVKVVKLWAASPPYVLVEPGVPPHVPQKGAVITSWQRAMLCKTWNAHTLTAIRVYRDAYRGTGPEQIPSLNSGATAKDLPTPALPDPTG